MKKLLKISMILAIMLTFFMNLSVFAVEETNSTTQNNSNLASSSVTSNSESSATTTTTSDNKSNSTHVSSVSAINQGDLSISDILNILLIAVGVVIILFAIAIFIKLK